MDSGAAEQKRKVTSEMGLGRRRQLSSCIGLEGKELGGKEGEWSKQGHGH